MTDDEADDAELPFQPSCSYLSASGESERDCAYIAQRYDADRGFRPRESESWVMLHRPTEQGVATSGNIPSSNWYTGLWRAPSGVVFVSDAARRAVYRGEDLAHPLGGVWSDAQLPAAMHGVWGLDERNVYAWGGNREGFPLFRWDGSGWRDMPSPGFEVYALHGTSPSCLWAVGDAGQAAFFDGGRWYPYPTPTSEVLNSVFVRDRDRVYATGAHGSLLEGATHGWTKIADGPGPDQPLFAVAWWGDALWVAARQWGLLRRVGTSDVLEPVQPELWAMSLEAREGLLITATHCIAGTRDGETFTTAGDGILDDLTAGRPLHFYRRGGP